MNVVYLSYTGLTEPLGQSQVLAYLRALSAEHRITLVTFEKPADLADTTTMEALRGHCAEHGIHWVPLRYHHCPRLPATAWDLVVLAFTALRQVRQTGAELVHARGHIPAFVALALKCVLGVPFIFDMRALWPEEMVTAGRLKRTYPMFRMITWGEKLCLRHAAAVVCLTHAAAAHLTRRYGTHPWVIPTCVDLDRFRCSRSGRTGQRPVIGSVGTVSSGWFRLDCLMTFFGACADTWPDVRFRVVTRDDPAPIATAAGQAGIAPERLTVVSCTPRDMPRALAGLDAVAMFFEPTDSELARCPTRLGEALASGLPVVTSDGVGDVAVIVRRYGVGVVVEDATQPSMRRAAAELGRLLEDPGLPARCRQIAEEQFSLEAGVKAYHALYSDVAWAPRTRFRALPQQEAE